MDREEEIGKTMSNIREELDEKKDICEMTCHTLWQSRVNCENEHKDITTCLERIKGTMQVKNSMIWEMTKVVAIPILTGALLYFGTFSALQTKVDLMSKNLDQLNILVIELIQRKR